MQYYKEKGILYEFEVKTGMKVEKMGEFVERVVEFLEDYNSSVKI